MPGKGSVPSQKGNKTKHSVIFFSFVVFQDTAALEGCLAKAVSALEESLGIFSDSAQREAAPGQHLSCPGECGPAEPCSLP